MKEKLEKRLELLQEKRKILEEKKYEFEDDYLEKECTYYEIDRILEEILEIKRKLYFLKTPCKEGEKIDLREITHGKSKIYYICLHNTDTIIGEISYRGYHIKKSLGDVGYEIYPEYRGNAYAYEALCLLGDMLKEKGIDDFWISTTEDNVPSQKTIEKYAGAKFAKEEDIIVYMCKTKKLENKRMNRK